MLIVTGGIACGKSSLAEAANELGLSTLDADDWFHNEIKPSLYHSEMYTSFFGNANPVDVAFNHGSWDSYQKILAKMFLGDMLLNHPDIVIIPELSYFDENILSKYYVLTIERHDNLKAANDRDHHRDSSVTKRIYENQTASLSRIANSNYVIRNDCGSREQFKNKCKEWLKLNLDTRNS